MTSRGSRRRRMRVLAAGSAVAAAVLAAGITAAVPAAPSPLPAALRAVPAAPSPLPAAPSPLSVVTSALARTSAQSYAFTVDTTVRTPERQLRSDLVSGAYDPRRHLGTEQLTARGPRLASRAQIRFIGAYLYTSASPRAGFGKPWDKSPLAAARAQAMPLGDLYGFASDKVVSPSELTVVLQSAGTVVRDSGPVSGPGWTGIKYTFTASLYGGQEPVSGSVCVDQQGRVRLMTTTTDRVSQPTGKPFSTTDRDITFGDFGAPVRVTAPPASQVEYTSGVPYWGFYF